MQDIIIFGLGEIGKGAISQLKNNYHILFLVDNDKNKWESMFEGYIVKSPAEMRQYECNIVITSTTYGIEIANQLQDTVGIETKRIYFCRRFLSDGIYCYDIYPFLEEMLLCTDLPLVQYDLTRRKECHTVHTKVLIFCTFYSVYAKQLIENLAKRYPDLEFSLLTSAKEYQEKISTCQLKHIYYFQTMTDLKTILEQLPVYDAMQLLWIEHEWSYFYKHIRKKTKHLNLNVGGSDFYRTVKSEKDFKKNLIRCADKVTAETIGTVQEFEAYYHKEVHGKTGLLPFGIEVLDKINLITEKDTDTIKKHWQIPDDKIVVTCGHNANKAHQHILIIDALRALPACVKEKIVCVFPMTYPEGNDTYIRKVRDNLRETGLTNVILTDFMDFQSMAKYAFISDVMIHVQTTDQLSSTMLEEMYAGSIVIAGSWLPYQSLHEMGLYFLNVDSVPEVTAAMENIIKNIDQYKEKCKGNSKIVWTHSSWDELSPKWRALWS